MIVAKWPGGRKPSIHSGVLQPATRDRVVCRGLLFRKRLGCQKIELISLEEYSVGAAANRAGENNRRFILMASEKLGAYRITCHFPASREKGPSFPIVPSPILAVYHFDPFVVYIPCPPSWTASFTEGCAARAHGRPHGHQITG